MTMSGQSSVGIPKERTSHVLFPRPGIGEYLVCEPPRSRMGIP